MDPNIQNNTVPVGQLYWPSLHEYTEITKSIIDREYYTNHGYESQCFECELEQFLGVKHAICVSSNTIGLIMAIEALELQGNILLPSFTFIASALSVKRCGNNPIFADIESGSCHLSSDSILEAIERFNISAILGVNLWGGCAPVEEITNIAQQYEIPLLWDSAQAFGCTPLGLNRLCGNYGQLEVFSFHATKVLSCGEGGCITTNNSELADRLRNIRSSYGVQRKMPVNRTTNGRMSEFQAAIGRWSLKNIAKHIDNNRVQRELYSSNLSGVKGVEIFPLEGLLQLHSNCQYMAISIDQNEFGMTRDELLNLLNSEGILARKYFYPGLHNLPQFEMPNQTPLVNTNELCSKALILPLGSRVNETVISRICSIIASSCQ